MISLLVTSMVNGCSTTVFIAQVKNASFVAIECTNVAPTHKCKCSRVFLTTRSQMPLPDGNVTQNIGPYETNDADTDPDRLADYVVVPYMLLCLQTRYRRVYINGSDCIAYICRMPNWAGVIYTTLWLQISYFLVYGDECEWICKCVTHWQHYYFICINDD